ncbi:MAG: pseudouridine synthase [Halobacteriovoraceae bacterium]|nr:pseudouridine synthase [Halobacteriovoraceae bacterium]
MKYIAFHKPFGVLSQFTSDGDTLTLSEFDLPKEVYAAGRLDKDSEGLLLLTDDGPFIKKVTDPKSKKTKTYHAQVEGIPNQVALQELRKGPTIKGYKCLPGEVTILENYEREPRVPPIRERKSIPTTWIEIKIVEGKNRQVRRMCAAVGHPCLRLIRMEIGKLSLGELKQGEWKEVQKADVL